MSQPKELGTLVVVVLKARHLHQPSFYKQDPYAQASLSGQTHKTKPDPKGGQHPVWDDEFRFPVLVDPGNDQVNRKLEVSCWKDEPRGEDKLLGKGVVDIESTLKTGEFDDWVQLETAGGARGELYLEMTFYANAPPPITRRPTTLKQSDRLERPQSYHPVPPKSGPVYLSPDASSLPGRSANITPVQLRDPGYMPPATLPTSLLPARGQPTSHIQPQTPPSKSPSPSPSRHSPQNKLDPLPPLPEEADIALPQRKPGHLPTILRPGGRPTPPVVRHGIHTENASMSDTPAHTSPLAPMSSLQNPTTELSELLGVRRTPLIITDEPIDEHYQPSFPIATSYTPEPQIYHTQGQGQPNHYLSTSSTPQQYPPPLQGYVPPQQTFSPPPQQSYTPQNYVPPSPQPQQYPSTSVHPNQYPVHQPPPPTLSYQPPPSHQPQSYSHQPYSPPPPPPPLAPQSHVPLTPNQSPQPQGYVQQQHQAYAPAPQQQTYQQQPYFHPPPPPPAQSPVPQPPAQSSPTSYFSPPPPPPPLPGSQQGTPALQAEPQSSVVQGYQNVAPAPTPPLSTSPALGPSTTPTSPPQTVPLTSSTVLAISGDQQKHEEEERIKAEEERLRYEERRRAEEVRKATEEAERRRKEAEDAQRQAAEQERRRQEEEEHKKKEQKQREEEQLKLEVEKKRREEERREREREEEQHRRAEEEQRQAEEAKRKQEEEECHRRQEEEMRLRLEQERIRLEEVSKKEEEQRKRKAEEEEALRRRAEEAEAERRWQAELARIKARAEQEASDAAYARAQYEAEEAEHRRREEADIAFARRAQEEAEQEQRAAEERRQQEELDSELARREQAHEEELERKRGEERRKQVEERDREMARKLDMELNLVAGNTSSSPELPPRRRTDSPHVPGGW